MVEGEKPDWERFGRASKQSAPEIQELYAWRAHPNSFDVASYYCQMWIHRAHVVMLQERGIITRIEAATILRGLGVVEKQAEGDPRLTVYMSTETTLIKEVGEVGGKMHTARSRNDLGHTQRRLYYRDQAERLIGAVIEFRERLIEAAEANLESYMPGYTHWRQAQPVTLAHYIMAHVEAAGRTVESLEGVYRRSDLSAMGAAAFAGTGWSIDRHRVRELLGFRDLVVNTQDAVAAIDYFMELSAAVAIHMSNLSRLAEDLQIWSSDEYRLLDFDEAYAGTSSIMPQKKNPLILEQVKSYAAEALGDMVAVVASMKGTAYTNIVDRVMLEPVSLDTAVGATRVMAGLVETLTPMKENMMMRLREGYSTMTELADTLVRLHGLGFRQAHDIVVEVTLDAIKDGIRAEDISPEMVEEASKKIIGKPLRVPAEELLEALDPVSNVKRRSLPGGPAPEAVKDMILGQRRRLEEEKARRRDRMKAIDRAKVKLAEAESLLK
ncbi:MAG: argininosuccinate lyase [Candidatus Bathyarchaeota archaeon]